MIDPSEAFRAALVHHRAGELPAAEALYREILQADPQHVEAIHHLGLVEHQAGRHQAGIELMSRSIELRGNEASFHSNLGEAYRALGRMSEAERCFRQALQLDPNLADAHNNLGNVLRSRGQSAAAIAAYERAISLRPGFAEAYKNLGAIRQSRGEWISAVACFRRAVEIDPRLLDAHCNLAAVFEAQGNLDEAVRSYEQAARLAPTNPSIQLRLGTIHLSQGQLDRAGAAYRQALRLDPRSAIAHNNLGVVLRDQYRLEEAEASLRESLQLDPELADAHFNLGTILHARRDWLAATAAYHEAVRLKPDFATVYNSLAVLFDELSQPDAAIENCRKGLALEPDSIALHVNLAIALQHQGRLDEAIACSRRAIQLHPEGMIEHSNLLFIMNAHPAYDAPTIFAEHLEWARRHAEPLSIRAAPHANERTPERRLRIGYVSPFFREHAVNYFTEPLLASHDHRNFEIFCYSDVAFPDGLTARLRSVADHWRDVCRQPDEQLAATVRDDAIDILVDLNGHVAGHRLLTFARKPAPIQVTYIGYQATTGMSAMDYRLTDAQADPPGLADPFYTEELVRLPRSFFCYQPAADPPVSPLPALEAGHVTFGSFNNFFKVTPQAIEAWLQILARVPRSRLLVLAYSGGYVQQNLEQLAQARGIDPGRIDVCDKRRRSDFARLVQRADIALDPFPFNGHTTTCDAIWLGVPVVMLRGQTYASRFGGSVLCNVGLEEWIADSTERYVDLAVKMSADVPGLAKLRSELRQRMAGSALLDFQGFARHVEQAYRQMWLKWCGHGSG